MLQQEGNKVLVIFQEASGRNHMGHNIKNCWFILKFDKLQIAKAFQIDVNKDLRDSETNTFPVQHVNAQLPDIQ